MRLPGRGRRTPRRAGEGAREHRGGGALESLTARARGVAEAAVDLPAMARGLLQEPLEILARAARSAVRVLQSAWRSGILPLLEAGAGLAAAAVHLAERVLTPARGLAVVALAASIVLGASQFGDYRVVEIGAPQYRGVQGLAPAPTVDEATLWSAHGASVFAIAIASLLLTTLAMVRNLRLARLLVFLGAAVVAISLTVDLPEGLREGTTGVAYEGSEAVLLGRFWAQLFCGVVLIVVGPLLAAQRRGARGPVARGSAAPRAGGGSDLEGAAT